MKTHAQRRVEVSRTLAVDPQPIFALLVDPVRHPEIDGSGMLRAEKRVTASRLHLGDTFSMRMQQARVPYRTVNTVVESEMDRLIAWETWIMLGRHKLFGGHRWRYELVANGDDTLVTESYDWTTARYPLLVELPRYPARMETAMSKTLERLDQVLAAGGPNPNEKPREVHLVESTYFGVNGARDKDRRRTHHRDRGAASSALSFVKRGDNS